MTACASQKPMITPEQFINTEWRLSEWEQNGRLQKFPRTISLQLMGEEDGSLRASGHTGCNRYFGSASFENGKLTVGPVSMTRMACPDESSNRYEVAFLKLLEGPLSVSINNSHMQLASSNEVLVFEKNHTRSLSD
ncbi:MAG: META domain-containing protein [Endozoicomonas sp.]